MSADYYQEIARILEAGKFHMAFFDDRLAMPDRYGNDHAHTVEYGIRCVKMDPIACLMPMAMATSRLGLGSTYSTTYYEPFHVARKFASLDHISGGRAGWNIVTTSNPDAALNFGLDEHMEHGERYARAREFYDVVTGLWDSWADDAFIRDADRGLYFDPDKLHVLDHKGKYLSVRGPLNIARPIQGWPVIVQAGASEAGCIRVRGFYHRVPADRGWRCEPSPSWVPVGRRPS